MTSHPEEHSHAEGLSSSGSRHPHSRQPGDARFGGPTREPRVTPFEDLETGAARIASALALLRHHDRATPDNWDLLSGLLDVLTNVVAGAVEDASEGFGARFSYTPTPAKLRALRGLRDSQGDLNGVVAEFLNAEEEE